MKSSKTEYEIEAGPKEEQISVLIICNDVIGNRMAGPAIRCSEIARITQRFFRTTLAAPQIIGEYAADYKLIQIRGDNLKAISVEADIVIIQGDALVNYPFLKEINGVLIADLYCPIPLEYHQSSDGIPMDVRLTTAEHLTEVVAEQLAYADYFLCASERQRDFWLGALMVTGRINALRWENAKSADINELIMLLPFGIPDGLPNDEQMTLRKMFNIPSDHFVLIWGGGIYEWFDPLVIIRAIATLVSQGRNVHLVFLGVKHPNPGINDHNMCTRAFQLAEELEIINRYVHFNSSWVEYSRRQEYLLDADVGVSAHFNNPETRFAFRTRILDYIWCGLPIIATKGDYFGDEVLSQKLGISVGVEDVAGWVNAISLMLEDREYYRKCFSNVCQYRDVLRWESATQDLIKAIPQMHKSRDRGYVRDMFNKRNAIVRLTLQTRFRHALAAGGVKELFNRSFKYVVRHVFKKR